MSEEEAPSKAKANWSSSFMRARTEMTATAVFILAVTHLGVTKFPFFGSELSHAPKATILLFLIGFFVYFTLAFCVKFRAEHGDVGLPIETLDRLDTGLHGKVERLFSFQSRPFADDVARHVETLNQAMTQYKNDAFAPIESMAQFFKERWHAQPHGMRPVFIEDVVPKIGIVMDEQTRNQILRFHNQALAEARQYNDKLYENNVLRLDRYASTHLETVTKTIDSFQQGLDDQIQAYQAEVAAKAEQVKLDMLDTKNEIERIRKEIRSLAKALTWDKIVLGFWVPLAFAVLCVAYALPQAVYDMAPLKAASSKCLPPTWSCFLRNAAT